MVRPSRNLRRGLTLQARLALGRIGFQALPVSRGATSQPLDACRLPRLLRDPPAREERPGGPGVGGRKFDLATWRPDPAASYPSGLSVARTNAGFAPTDLADLRDWAATAGRRVLLWTVRSPKDWKGFKGLRGLNPELAGRPTAG
jgi:hypothetical protein